MANHEGLNQYSPEDAQEEAGELQAEISQEQAANQAAKEEMIACLKYGYISYAIAIKEQFALP